MAWRWPGDKPLSEPMMVRLLMHICVNELKPLSSFQYQGIILNAWDNNVFNIALWALCLEVLEHMLFEDLFPLFAEHLIAFYQGYVDWMVCLGPIQLMIFDAKLNSDLNHIRSHSNFCASDHYNFFHMPRQLCCRGMHKILWWWHHYDLEKSEMKLPSYLTCVWKNQ